MDRREALKRAALLSGFAISAPLASALLTGCETAPTEAAYTPSFFNEEEYTTLRSLVDRMLPRTDTPGGLDVGVPEMMDSYLAVIYKPKDRQRFRAGLQEFSEGAQAELGKSFNDFTETEQFGYMNQVQAIAYKQVPQPNDAPFFSEFMQLALFGYFTSEKVATEVLAYDPVPGVYQGCIPFEEVGKTWAL